MSQVLGVFLGTLGRQIDNPKWLQMTLTGGESWHSFPKTRLQRETPNLGADLRSLAIWASKLFYSLSLSLSLSLSVSLSLSLSIF